MRTLFIDTHGELITIAFIKDKEIFIKEKYSEYSHATIVLPLLNEMLKENKIKLNEFNKIIVVNGPGSFTGIRIGLTIAKTIAYSLNIPIHTISSLKAYLLSSDEDGICMIEDPKGFYIGIKNGENVEETYTYEPEEYNSYKIIENNLNIIKIVNYFNDKEPLKVHSVNANYIKVIEVLK